MAIQVADLFVSLVIKGQDKTVGELQSVNKEMGGLASVSLEAKAAIVGAAYALQQLFQHSGKQGTDLTNFSALLGEGTQTLQRYQGALRQVGVSNEETEATFKNLSSASTKAAYNLGGRPSGTAQIAKYSGGNISQTDFLRYAQHPEELLKRIQTALKNAPTIERGLLTEAA